MTTTVTIFISGNKACGVSVTSRTPDGFYQSTGETLVIPGTFITKTIHGDQVLEITEVGEFL